MRRWARRGGLGSLLALALAGGCSALFGDDLEPPQGEAGAGGSAAGAGGSAAGVGGSAAGAGGQAGGGAAGAAGMATQAAPIAAGAIHNCAIVAGGEVRCWGSNQFGQLGNGKTTDWYEGERTPVTVVQSLGGPPLIGAKALALGGHHSCALMDEGEVLCWGGNEAGQLGNGTMTTEPPFGLLTPVPVLREPGGPPLSGVRALAAGAGHNCALTEGGKALCWGDASSGQLGNGTGGGSDGVFFSFPVPVLQSPGGPPLAGVQALALGGHHGCALMDRGEVLCWGGNHKGQLGNGTTTTEPPYGLLTPVPVLREPGGPPLTGARSLALGNLHSCALMDRGEVLCWGCDLRGQLGTGTIDYSRHSPVSVLREPGGPPLTGAQVLALGDEHSCALLSNGTVHCWGTNCFGVLWNSTPTWLGTCD